MVPIGDSQSDLARARRSPDAVGSMLLNIEPPLEESQGKNKKAEFFLNARQLVRWFRDQAALRTGSGNLCSGSARSRRQASSSPLRRAASSAAKASTPWGDQLIPWSLQRADTAQSQVRGVRRCVAQVRGVRLCFWFRRRHVRTKAE